MYSRYGKGLLETGLGTANARAFLFEKKKSEEISMRKRRHVQEKLLLAAPAKQISMISIREGIVSLLDSAKSFLKEPEAKDSDIEEDICWILLLLPILECLSVPQDTVHPASWWYKIIGEDIKSDKQMTMLASAINIASAAT